MPDELCRVKLGRQSLALYVAARERIFPTCAEKIRLIPTEEDLKWNPIPR
jgi:hypothetical protein